MKIFLLFINFFVKAFENFAYFDGVRYGVIEDVTSSLATSCDTTGKFLVIINAEELFHGLKTYKKQLSKMRKFF